MALVERVRERVRRREAKDVTGANARGEALPLEHVAASVQRPMPGEVGTKPRVSNRKKDAVSGSVPRVSTASDSATCPSTRRERIRCEMPRDGVLAGPVPTNG